MRLDEIRSDEIRLDYRLDYVRLYVRLFYRLGRTLGKFDFLDYVDCIDRKIDR